MNSLGGSVSSGSQGAKIATPIARHIENPANIATKMPRFFSVRKSSCVSSAVRCWVIVKSSLPGLPDKPRKTPAEVH